MAIGTSASMIDSGSWQVDEQPLLPKSKKQYQTLFRFGFQYKNFKFLCELLKDKKTNETCFFIYPYNRRI